MSRKNVLVYPEICSSEQCSTCMAPQCQLCLPCLTNETLNTLKEAYKEHTNKHDCKRVFPPSMVSYQYRVYIVVFTKYKEKISICIIFSDISDHLYI